MSMLGQSSLASPSTPALPEQSEDQLQLGFRIIQNAYGSKVQSLEQEVRALRLQLDESKGVNTQLQRKNSQLEVELVEGHQKAQQLAEENKELFKTVTTLRRQLQRLEGLKKKVCESIADHHQSADGEDSSIHLRDDYLSGMAPLTMQAAGGTPMTSGFGASGFSRPASRPTSPPRHGLSASLGATAPTGFASAPTEPFVSQAAAYPGPGAAAYGDSVGSRPLQAADNPVDGKQFFRQARSQLSYEAFNEFLSSIKKLNNQSQTRQQTLDEARRIFGPDLRHLYEEFETLLNRHAM